MEAYKWFWGYLKKYRVSYPVTMLFSTAVIILALIVPFVYGYIVKFVFEEGRTELLLPLLGAAVGVTVIKGICRYISIVSYDNMAQDMIFTLRQDIYERIQTQSFSFFDKNKVGDIMSKMTGDLEAIRHFVAYVIYASYENILVFVVALSVMFTISWQVTLFMLLVAPCICFIAVKQAKRVKPAFTTIREQFSSLNSVCQENISGNRVVKAFTREAYEIEKFNAENQAFYDANVNASKIWLKYLPVQDFLASVLNIVLILVGGIMVILDKLELNQLVVMNGYLWAINNPMRMVGWLINDLRRFTTSLDKVYGMRRIKIELKNPENPVSLSQIKGAVRFDDVTFSYDKFNLKAAVLKHISFEVKPGQTVGIVGPTGSGKTTLVNLIARFYDATEGAVYVDGVNVKDLDLHCLRRDISMAMQDVFLFSDTVEGNLAYGVPDAPLDSLIDAAKTADADGFVRNMPEGYDTIVGERGVGLSGGQRQRLSLARAIATNPSVLVLDDTTSAVDMETEHEIQTALNEHYSDRTKFIIAHRISSVKSADIILVLVNGEIIERGTHDELVAQKGYYYGLFTDQYGDIQNDIIKQGGAVDGAK